ncbi:hypothetical protein MAC3UK_0046 [Bdellovibrio phage MAC3UK]|nr:hypothetical protein MAC3UK_0046 [Bdellovibrio phage MAC3UK]
MFSVLSCERVGFSTGGATSAGALVSALVSGFVSGRVSAFDVFWALADGPAFLSDMNTSV